MPATLSQGTKHWQNVLKLQTPFFPNLKREFGWCTTCHFSSIVTLALLCWGLFFHVLSFPLSALSGFCLTHQTQFTSPPRNNQPLIHRQPPTLVPNFRGIPKQQQGSSLPPSPPPQKLWSAHTFTCFQATNGPTQLTTTSTYDE